LFRIEYAWGVLEAEQTTHSAPPATVSPRGYLGDTAAVPGFVNPRVFFD
jgi:hypothetical protein